MGAEVGAAPGEDETHQRAILEERTVLPPGFLSLGVCHLSPPPRPARRRGFVGEVEPGVEAELGPGPAVVGPGGLALRGEVADADHLMVEANGRFPAAAESVVGNALEA